MFCRRLLLTADPAWPALKATATMEALSVHLSERKIAQLSNCLERITGLADKNEPAPPASETQPVTVSHSHSRLVPHCP